MKIIDIWIKTNQWIDTRRARYFTTALHKLSLSVLNMQMSTLSISSLHIINVKQLLLKNKIVVLTMSLEISML